MHDVTVAKDDIKDLNYGYSELSRKANKLESNYLANVNENKEIFNLINNNSFYA